MQILSTAERAYIRGGATRGIRNDGRGREDIRPVSLETGLLPTASGSARVRIGTTTDILVGIKPELTRTQTNQGNIMFSIECSSLASPDFVGKGGKELEAELGGILNTMYKGAKDMKKNLYIGKGWSWTLHVDALVLDSGGNLIGAVSMAVYAALKCVKLPEVSVIEGEADEEADVQVDEGVMRGIEGENPVVVCVNRVGGKWCVDCTSEEEESGGIWVGVGKEELWGVGGGGVEVECVEEGVKLAVKVGRAILKELENREEMKEIVGFFA